MTAFGLDVNRCITVENVLGKLDGRKKLVVAIDVAKTDMVAALSDPGAAVESQVLVTVAWRHPMSTGCFGI
jgi:hypothetical protein